MAWCEENGVEYVFALTRNDRLVAKIARELKAAEKEAAETRRPVRRINDFSPEAPQDRRPRDDQRAARQDRARGPGLHAAHSAETQPL